MDKLTSTIYSKVSLTEPMKKMYINIIKKDEKLLKVLQIILDNTVYVDNPGKIGTTKEMIINQLGFTKYYTDILISYLTGATFIYYDTLYDSKGKYYSLTLRGSEIVAELVRGGYLKK